MAKNLLQKNIFVLSSPRVTEKASMLQERNVYVFNVPVSVTKKDVEKAVKEQYKVTPLRVNMVQIKSKKTFVRNKLGKTAKGKKAYIFLKKGDTLKTI